MDDSLKTVAAAIAQLARLVTDPGRFKSLLRRLERNHFAQWCREDQAHGFSGDSEVGRVKKRIDNLNKRRWRLIEQLDSTYVARPSKSILAFPALMTFGELCDRVIIASLRHRMTETVNEQSLNQLRAVCDGVSGIVSQILSGDVDLPTYQHMKSYGRSRH